MALGLTSGRVVLTRAHAAWADAFRHERARLALALGGDIAGIEHVGSTSIPDVPAKPILDILVGVFDFDEAWVCVSPMKELGYEYRGNHGIPGRHYFVMGDPRTHHVHMLEVRSEDWKRTLEFRDRLRASQPLAGEYARAKERLARSHVDDRKAYQREKGTLIERLLGESDGCS